MQVAAAASEEQYSRGAAVSEGSRCMSLMDRNSLMVLSTTARVNAA